MSTPVVLIGVDAEGVAVIGLYESNDAAAEAVRLRDVPTGFAYSTFTLQMNGYVHPGATPLTQEVRDGRLVLFRSDQRQDR